MKNVPLAVVIAASLAGAGTAEAQAFGQFTGAETLPVNGRMFGAYAHSSENTAGLLAQLRLSFYPGVDFGFQGGLTRQDFGNGNRTDVRLGADLKVQVKKEDVASPVTLAAGGCLGVETGDNFNVLTLGPTLVASHDYPMGQSGGVTPYAGIGLAVHKIDVGSGSDSDLALPVRLGSEFKVSPQLKLSVELQLNISDSFNDKFGLAAGANLPF